MLLDLDADSLHKVGFTHACRAEHKQGIERLQRRVIGDRLTYRTRDFVRCAAAIVLESVARIQLGVDGRRYGGLEHPFPLTTESRRRGQTPFGDFRVGATVYLKLLIIEFYILAENMAQRRSDE